MNQDFSESLHPSLLVPQILYHAGYDYIFNHWQHRVWMDISHTERCLPYHVYSSTELWVEQQRQDNWLPQVVTGYYLDPFQTTLIQSVPQQLVQSGTIKQEDREQRKTWTHSCHDF